MANHLSELKNLWNDLNSKLENKKESRLLDVINLQNIRHSYHTLKSIWLLLSDEKKNVKQINNTAVYARKRIEERDSRIIKIKNQEAVIVSSDLKYKSFSSMKMNRKCNYCY